jgi:hypothetical protein
MTWNEESVFRLDEVKKERKRCFDVSLDNRGIKIDAKTNFKTAIEAEVAVME